MTANSYPSKAGLTLDLVLRYCTLFRAVKHWNHWYENAESVHKIRRENFIEAGF